MVSRREFIKSSSVLGAAAIGAPSLILPKKSWAQALTAAAGPLDPATQPRWVNTLPNPLDPTFNFLPTGTAKVGGKVVPAFDLRIRQFSTDTGLFVPNTTTPLGATTKVWGYGTALQAPTYPGRTFQVATGTQIQVAYNNQLGTARNPLPHFLPVDPTLDWANPANVGAISPVPLVAHLHGGDSRYLSDGLPDAWETAGAAQKGILWSKPYLYDNSQEAGHLWYHDHALGVTRVNVYAGLAGNYFIRGVDELLLIGAKKLPVYPYEVPILIQDRNFLDNGELFYPSQGIRDPNDPDYDPAYDRDLTHLPEFFGDVMLVNGKAWPKLDVEPRQYRLRLLNGSDSRVYQLKIEEGIDAGRQVPMYVIGTELGMLNAPVRIDTDPQFNGRLPIAPGERYDVIVDFTGLRGFSFTLTNDAPAPYPDPANDPPGTTAEIMRFNVVKPLSSIPTTTLPTNLRPISGPLPRPAAPVNTRRIMLFEGTDPLGRLMTMIGPVDPVGGVQGTLFYKDPITEKPKVNTTEVWEFYNTTVDAHPIHMHLVDFKVLGRQEFTGTVADKAMGAELNYAGGKLLPESIQLGAALPSRGWEDGRKDTVITLPGTVTRVTAKFKRTGPYVYHCHILSHEDHEMMRPYEVIP